jgi:hypothetical protein
VSYPEPKYFGDGGEVTAQLRRTGKQPELVNSRGGTVEYLALGSDTNREFGPLLLRQRRRASGSSLAFAPQARFGSTTGREAVPESIRRGVWAGVLRVARRDRQR